MKRATKIKRLTREQKRRGAIDREVDRAVIAAVAKARAEERKRFLQFLAAAKDHWNAPLNEIESAVRGLPL